MANRSRPVKSKRYNYFYHACRTNHHHGDTACAHKKNHRAEKLEATVWEVVSGLLEDPERLREGLEDMIERERKSLRGNTDELARVWLDKVAEVDRKRSRFQDMAAEGHIILGELGAKLDELEEIR